MPLFTLPTRPPQPSDAELLQPSGGRAPAKPLPAEAQGPTNTPDTRPSMRTDPTDDAGHSTRDFPRTWDTSPSVGGPLGPMNVGYTHNVVSTNAQWARGELPDLGYGYTFALRFPRVMREPRTDLGSYNLARG